MKTKKTKIRKLVNDVDKAGTDFLTKNLHIKWENTNAPLKIWWAKKEKEPTTQAPKQPSFLNSVTRICCGTILAVFVLIVVLFLLYIYGSNTSP